MASVLSDQRRYAEAENLEREVTETLRSTLGESHLKTLAATNHLAYILEQKGRHAGAEPLLRGAQTTFEKAQPNDWQRFNCRILLGSSLAGQGKYQDAEPLLLEGYAGGGAANQITGVGSGLSASCGDGDRISISGVEPACQSRGMEA